MKETADRLRAITEEVEARVSQMNGDEKNVFISGPQIGSGLVVAVGVRALSAGLGKAHHDECS